MRVSASSCVSRKSAPALDVALSSTAPGQCRRCPARRKYRRAGRARRHCAWRVKSYAGISRRAGVFASAHAEQSRNEARPIIMYQNRHNRHARPAKYRGGNSARRRVLRAHSRGARRRAYSLHAARGWLAKSNVVSVSRIHCIRRLFGLGVRICSY